MPHLSMVSVEQRPRSGKKKSLARGAGRAYAHAAGRPAGPVRRGPVVGVSYSPGHARLAGKWGVCLRFGGNNISVLGVGGDTYGYPYFGGFLAAAQFPAGSGRGCCCVVPSTLLPVRVVE